MGHGRQAYAWSMFAALGLFAAGATVSVTHGITELLHPTPAEHFGIGYAVMAISFVLKGLSFLQPARQAKKEAGKFEDELVEHVLTTSDPTFGRYSPRTPPRWSAW